MTYLMNKRFDTGLDGMMVCYPKQVVARLVYQLKKSFENDSRQGIMPEFLLQHEQVLFKHNYFHFL